jgi:hypothetical protein
MRIPYDEGVSPTDSDAVRAMSRVAFRQDYRLELMVAIAESTDGIVCLTDLARVLDVSISNLQVPLKNLITLGLITPLPRGDSRRKFYMRNPSPAWDWARELIESARSAALQP